MGFHEDAIFPSKLAGGSQFGLRHQTSVVSNTTGHSQRIPRLDTPLIVADVSSAITSPDGANELLRFFTARQGATYAFRFPHPLDRSTASNSRSDDITPYDQRIGVGDGVTKRFQLSKGVHSGGITRRRTITKPVEGRILIGVDGDPATDYTVDPTTGEVLFQNAPRLDVAVTCGCIYDIPMRFEESVEDSMLIGYEPADNALIPQVQLVEERFSDITHGEFFFGGTHSEPEMGFVAQLSLLRGRVVDLTPSSPGRMAHLPDFTDLPTGGPYFYVNNRSDSTPFNLADYDGVVLASVAPAQTRQVLLVDTVAGKRWVVM